MDAENIRNAGCSQRDSAEHKGHVRAHRSFNRIWKERDSAQPNLLEKILEKDNLNRAFKRVKANKGAPGVDGMTIDESDGWRFRSRMVECGNLAFPPSQTVPSNRPWHSR